MFTHAKKLCQKIIAAVKELNSRYSLAKLMTGAILMDATITIVLLCCCGNVEGWAHKFWAFAGTPAAQTKLTKQNQANLIQTEKSAEVSYHKTAVTALGRLEPVGEIVKISVPAIWKDERVAQLLVQQSDFVKTGQVLAVLDSRARQKAALDEAQEQVEVAAAQLAKVQAGAKQGEIEAQRRTVASLKAELEGKKHTQQAIIDKLHSQLLFAKSEYFRHTPLYQEGAISASILDSKRMAFESTAAAVTEAEAEMNRNEATLKEKISEAIATLDKVSEVRTVDVNLAMREVDAAQAKANKIMTDLNLCYVRAPKDGQVLKIHVRPGESVPESKGILDLGSNRKMVAVAEVYQSDVHAVRLGQKATVSVEGLSQKITGRVWQVGLEVLRQNVFAAQPGANQDRRVVEVKVLIDDADSAKVSGLSNMQVEVAIAAS